MNSKCKCPILTQTNTITGATTIELLECVIGNIRADAFECKKQHDVCPDCARLKALLGDVWAILKDHEDTIAQCYVEDFRKLAARINKEGIE